MEPNGINMFSEELIDIASRTCAPTDLTLREIGSDPGHALYREVRRHLSTVGDDLEVARGLERTVSARRLRRLREQASETRPDPYGHPDLAGLAVDGHGLMDLRLLDQREGGFASGETVFEIMPSIDARNSSHWTGMSLDGFEAGVKPRIRLDPFMCAPRAGYCSMMYKMFVYGRPLTWKNIFSLTEESHHRWMPDRQDSDVAFTDAVWTPRANEVHLRCEECPKPSAIRYRPSRFFHAIIDRDARSVVHTDGALRIFDDTEADARMSTHVRSAGKVGVRVKLFQLDGLLPTERWTELIQAFFIWNDDVRRFVAAIATDAL